MKRFNRACPDTIEGAAPCKRCAKCRERKTLDNFFLCKPKNSTPFYYYLCHGCKNERQRELRKVRPTKPAPKKVYSYVSKVWPIAGDTPAKVAAKFLDSEFVVAKAILRKDDKYFMASANGKLPERFELLGIFNCNMPYRDLVRELAA